MSRRLQLAFVVMGAVLWGSTGAGVAQDINPVAASEAKPPQPDNPRSPTVDAVADAVIARLRATPEILADILLEYTARNRAGQSLVHPDDPATGPDSADIAIVEFFDPSCAVCRETAVALDAVATQDGHIKVIHKDFPTTNEGVQMSLDALGGDYQAARSTLLAGGNLPHATASGRVKATRILAQDREDAAKVGVKVLPTLFFAGLGHVDRLEGPASASDLAKHISELRKQLAAPPSAALPQVAPNAGH